MRSQNSDLESTANTMERVERQKSNGTTSNLSIFRWRRKNNSQQEREKELVDAEGTDHKHPSSSGGSGFGFFKNIKKYLHLKSNKPKQKIELTVDPITAHLNTFGYISIIRIFYPHQYPESTDDPGILSDGQVLYDIRPGDIPEDYYITRANIDYTNIHIEDEIEPHCPSNLIPDTCNAMLAADPTFGMNKLLQNGIINKMHFIEDLLYLSKCGWYWGPVSVSEANAIFKSEPNGAFLVQDSLDERYFLTVTFKSFGELMHIDMEYNSSLFSIYGQRPHNKRNFSLVALINHSINYIKYDNVSWFSSEHKPDCSRFPFGLTKPVCRFSRLKSLQYLCTYVICLNTKLEHVDRLPLPNSIKKYIYEIYVKYVYEI